MVDVSHWQTVARDIVALAKKQGATDAEVTVNSSDGFAVSVRLGEVETLEYQRDKSIDITVYIGKQRGSSSCTDIRQESLHNAVLAACDIARATQADPCHGLADAHLLAKHYPELDLCHPWDIEVAAGIELATECEQVARHYDKKITNSEGAGLSTYKSFHLYANSADFMGHYFSTRHFLNCSVIAESKNEKQRDYDYTQSRMPEALSSAKQVGEGAAARVLKRLNAKRLSTRQAPVIFHADMARSLLGSFIGAIEGGRLYHRASFLVDHLGKKIFPDNINISENPHELKGWGSVPYDAEGVMANPRTFVENGVLKSYVLDSYTARKLKMVTTGNAGGVRNLSLQPTDGKLEDVVKKMHTGLLVTELLGQGVNILTGDYSRGAAGFWVEQGEIQYPVHEITIAGNLREMFQHIAAVGSDVDHRGNIKTGSVLIEQMMIAGD